jgi:hypothetical protein
VEADFGCWLRDALFFGLLAEFGNVEGVEPSENLVNPKIHFGTAFTSALLTATSVPRSNIRLS